jgi:type IV secretory pathway VirB10-like protein
LINQGNNMNSEFLAVFIFVTSILVLSIGCKLDKEEATEEAPVENTSEEEAAPADKTPEATEEAPKATEEAPKATEEAPKLAEKKAPAVAEKKAPAAADEKTSPAPKAEKKE